MGFSAVKVNDYLDRSPAAAGRHLRQGIDGFRSTRSRPVLRPKAQHTVLSTRRSVPILHN